MIECFELSNGIKLPAIGFGPGICGYSAKYVRRCSGLLSIPGRAYNRLVKRPFVEKEYIEGIASAIRSGYRLIDYSAAYGDGSLVGKGIKTSGVSRDELNSMSITWRYCLI